jgi:hypothetical protein
MRDINDMAGLFEAPFQEARNLDLIFNAQLTDTFMNLRHVGR